MLTDEQRVSIEQAVQVVLDKIFQTAREVDFDSALPLFSTDFVGANLGFLFPTFSAFEAAYRPGFAQLEKQDINVKETIVTVFAPNVASAITLYNFTAYGKDGTTGSSDAAITFIFVKEGEDWKAVHMHQSMPFPQQD